MKEKDQGFDNFQTKPIASIIVTILVDITKLGGYFFFVLYELDRSNLRLPKIIIGKVL